MPLNLKLKIIEDLLFTELYFYSFVIKTDFNVIKPFQVKHYFREINSNILTESSISAE